jgi:hypothetical protein
VRRIADFLTDFASSTRDQFPGFLFLDHIPFFGNQRDLMTYSAANWAMLHRMCEFVFALWTNIPLLQYDHLFSREEIHYEAGNWRCQQADEAEFPTSDLFTVSEMIK